MGMDSFNRKVGNRPSDLGYSLIELLIALTIGLTVLGAASGFVMTHVQTQIDQGQISRMQQAGRLGLEVMLRELRLAGFDPTGDAEASLTLTEAHSIGFSMDLNSDGDVLDSGEAVSYGLLDVDEDGATDLVRTSEEDDELVASRVSGLTFLYVMSDGSEVYVPEEASEVRKVKVTVLMRSDSSESTEGDSRLWILSRIAQLRNMALKETLPAL